MNQKVFRHFIAIGCAAVLLSSLFLWSACRKWSSDSVKAANKSADFSATTVTINADVATVRVCPAEGESASVAYFEDEIFSVSHSESEDGFVLEQKVTQNAVTYSGEITLYLPLSRAGEYVLSLDVCVGGIQVSGIGFKTLSLAADVGNISVSDLSAQTVYAETDTGDVFAERIKADTISLAADVGDISASVSGVETDYSVTGKTDVGSKNFSDRTAATGKSVTLRSSAGSLSLSFVNE